MKNKELRTILIIGYLFLGIAQSWSQNYLHTEGKKILDGEGSEFIIRAMNFGGWMLQEGYMLETSSFANTQHEIRASIEALIGPENTDTFYSAWLDNHVRRCDVDSLASWGFNAIRLPMHYNLFTPQNLPVGDYINKGFELVDSLLAWCEANQIYLILDLHGAPGGQGDDAGICDYDPKQPSLWESEENKARTIDLWKTLAARYANEEWIGGYDLINEPKWDSLLTTNNSELWELLIQITDSIRNVDQNHMIIIEGNIWANNYTGFPGPWDDNLVISFHKYWNPNTISSIQWVLDMRDQYNVPVWLGETGENSNTWFVEQIELLEQNSIGYAYWPEKKLTSVAGLATVQKTAAYQQLLNYWNNPSTQPRPDTAFAKSALMELTEKLKLENCRINRDVTDVFSRQINNTTTIPYLPNLVPGIIYATNYDIGRQGYAYFDTDYQNINNTQYNSGGKYRNDGVDIETCTDVLNTNGYNVGWTTEGEWLKYTIQVDSTAGYDLVIRYAGTNSSTLIRLLLDTVDITGFIEIPSTGAWNVWDSLTLRDIILSEGTHSLVFRFEKGGCNLSYIDFENPKPTSDISFKTVSAETNSDGTLIFTTLNKECDPSVTININEFTLYINDDPVNPENVGISAQSNKIILISTESAIDYNDILTLSYSGSSIITSEGQQLNNFTNLSVVNNMPARHIIPCKIEAEDYFYQSGIDTETTNDSGGGLNIGYTDAGDYLDYLIDIPESNTYQVNFRIASLSQSGAIQLQLIDSIDNIISLGNYTLPVTGGWQSWQTKSGAIEFPSGMYTLRLKVITAGFNLNWLSFSEPSFISEKIISSDLVLFPNPCNDELYFHSDKIDGENLKCQISDLAGRMLIEKVVNLYKQEYCRIDTSSLKTGIYILSFQNADNSTSALFSVSD